MRRCQSQSWWLGVALALSACEPATSTSDAPASDGGALDAATSDACASRTYYRDQDGDGHGARDASVTACAAPPGYVVSSDDCDDACSACAPGMAEVCEGSLDESCDGSVDEGCACTPPASRPCGIDVGECVLGTQTCDAGAWTTCNAIGPTAEVCNGLDEDCNGRVDDGSANASCSLSRASSTCTAAACAIASCDVGFGDCNGVADDGCERAFGLGECACGGCAPGNVCGSSNGCQFVGATSVAIPIGGEPVALVEDASGNLYVVGHYATGGEHFGDATPAAPTADHAYVVGFDADGGYRWFTDLGTCPAPGCAARTMDARTLSSGGAVAVAVGRAVFVVHADGTASLAHAGIGAMQGSHGIPPTAVGRIDDVALLHVLGPGDGYGLEEILSPATDIFVLGPGEIDSSTTWDHFGTIDAERASGYVGGVSENAETTAFGIVETNPLPSCVGALQRHTRLWLRSDESLVSLDGTEAGFADEFLDATRDDIAMSATLRWHLSARLSLGATARVATLARSVPAFGGNPLFGTPQSLGVGFRRIALVGAPSPMPFTIVDEGPGTLEQDSRGRSWIGYSLRDNDTFQGVPVFARGAGDVIAARLTSTGLPDVLLQTGGPGDERAVDYVAQNNGAAILATFSGTARFGEHDLTSFGPDDGVLWIVRPSCAGGGTEDCDAAGDEDCDGEMDEGCGCTADTTCGSGVGACAAVARACVGGVLEPCAAHRATPEACDGVDDDCDGVTDEASLCPGASHAVGVCASGACTSSCLPGFADCNGLAVDGCEADLASVATCGACTVACGATERCRSSACEARPRPHVWAASTAAAPLPEFPQYEARVQRFVAEQEPSSAITIRARPDDCSAWYVGASGHEGGGWAPMPRGGAALFYVSGFETQVSAVVADAAGHWVEDLRTATLQYPPYDDSYVVTGTVACDRLRSDRAEMFWCMSRSGVLTARDSLWQTTGVRGAPFVDGGDRYCEVGTFSGSTTALGVPITSAGGTDIFIACLSTADASPTSATTFGGAGDETVVAAQADGYGAGIVVGTFVGATTLGGTSLVSHGGADVFVLGVDAALAPTFVLSGGSAEDDTIAIESVRPDRTFHLRGTMGAGDHDLTATFGSSTFTGREYHWVVDTTP